MDKHSRKYPNRLQMFRKGAGYQQQHVATLLGLNNPASLSDWENEKQMPNGTNLIKLCIIYNTTPQQMYPEYFQQLLIGYLNRTT
ncbi:MAG: helix-turn-helix domain-containing protein [Gammaproteobacteria bacterium]|nr:helix-turn-helix domain-containing protein [Gammaproteobacteria bacterium]